MISFLNRLFGREDDSTAQESSDTETVRRIVGELDRLDPDEARYLASFAFVLARVAYSDSEISRDESRRMEHIVRDVGGLSEAQAVLVVQIAKSQQLLKGGTENYLVTREFGRIADAPGRRPFRDDVHRAGRQPLGHFRFEKSRRQRIDPDAFAARPLLRQVAGQPEQPRLAGAVSRLRQAATALPCWGRES